MNTTLIKPAELSKLQRISLDSFYDDIVRNHNDLSFGIRVKTRYIYELVPVNKVTLSISHHTAPIVTIGWNTPSYYMRADKSISGTAHVNEDTWDMATVEEPEHYLELGKAVDIIAPIMISRLSKDHLLDREYVIHFVMHEAFVLVQEKEELTSRKLRARNLMEEL